MDSLGASWATDVAFIEGIPVAWSSNCLRCHDGVVHVLPCRHLIFHSLVVAALFTGRVVRHVVGGYLDLPGRGAVDRKSPDVLLKKSPIWGFSL